MGDDLSLSDINLITTLFSFLHLQPSKDTFWVGEVTTKTNIGASKCPYLEQNSAGLLMFYMVSCTQSLYYSDIYTTT